MFSDCPYLRFFASNQRSLFRCTEFVSGVHKEKIEGNQALKPTIRAYVYIFTAVLWCISVCGCGGSGEEPWRFDPGIPAKVTEVTAVSGFELVTLSWKPSTYATSYNVYYVPASTASGVTRTNGTRLSIDGANVVISGLQNDTKYFFMVTALNRDGESTDSDQASATPGPFTSADLAGEWYFHALVNGPDAKWERGLVSVDDSGTTVFSQFEDSSGNSSPPAGYILTVDGIGQLGQTGDGAHVQFHGTISSRKNMILATYSHSLTSQALIIFQKKKDATAPDYNIEDIAGSGSGQSTTDPNLLGNGPTRFAYHQLSSGASTDWEYCNGKVGQNGYTWINTYKDITYWDYGSPEAKTHQYLDYLWKVTSFGIDPDGLVSEYWNYEATGDFVSHFIRQPHEVVFRGRMTADKTVVIGVGTKVDALGAQKYYLRVIELCFTPWDQNTRTYNLSTLAGSYSFYKLSSSQWANGRINIASSGTTSFSDYSDSDGNTSFPDSFTLQYYPDPGLKAYKDFANFITPDPVPTSGSGSLHYYDSFGELLHTFYDFWSYPAIITEPDSWRTIDSSNFYYNEHGSQSFFKDMFVMTRTDASGHALYVAVK